MTISKQISVVLILFVCISGIGQKCKNSSKGMRKANKHFTEEKIIKATKPKTLFSKFSQAASANFVKSSENYYLSLVLVREMGRRINILIDNPLVIQFENDHIETLYPDRTLLGKFTLPVTTEINRPFYKVSKKQLELFTQYPIAHVKVYFSSDKTIGEDKFGTDDSGTFFDYGIRNENLRSSLMEPAKCIAQ